MRENCPGLARLRAEQFDSHARRTRFTARNRYVPNTYPAIRMNLADGRQFASKP